MYIKCGRELNIKLNLFSVTENAREFCFCLFEIWCDVNYFPVFRSIGNKKNKAKNKAKDEAKNESKEKSIQNENNCQSLVSHWCSTWALRYKISLKSTA